DRDSHFDLYKVSNQVCKNLNLTAQVTFYQEQNSIQDNCAISIIEDEAHIVFSGNLLELLDERQLTALIAHELGHFLFFKIENGEFEITQRIILALANDSQSDPVFVETARKFQLFLELFCDACSFQVCREHYSVIQCLVKVSTGLKRVNAQSYLD
ncbi:peptidase M48, partial [Pseudomonas fluorescens]